MTRTVLGSAEVWSAAANAFRCDLHASCWFVSFPFCLFHDCDGKRTSKHDQKIIEAALGNERTGHEPRVGGVEGWRRGIHGR